MQLALAFNKVRDTWSARKDGFLFVLARPYHHEGSAELREYMIVARLGKHPNGYLLEPVCPKKHHLVQHSGFECSGSMCRTVAWVVKGPNADIRSGMLTPGRVQDLLKIADDVNTKWSMPIWEQEELDKYKNRGDWCEENWKPNPNGASGILGWYKPPREKPTPGEVYVAIGETRACGLVEPPTHL